MRYVRCYVDLHSVGPEMLARTKAFNSLCLLFMLLQAWERTTLCCICGCNGSKAWVIDWKSHPPKKDGII
jgi:hypothetical protein